MPGMPKGWPDRNVLLGAVVVAAACVAFVWWLSDRSSALQGAITALAAVLAGSATAWAAYQSRISAQSSAAAAREARLAHALINQPVAYARLERDHGAGGASWLWAVESEARPVADIRLTWTVDGSRKEASHPRLQSAERWRTSAYLAGEVTQADAARRIGNLEMESQDTEGLMRWRSVAKFVDMGKLEGVTDTDIVAMDRVTGPEPVW
jgi:hypothetical protein